MKCDMISILEEEKRGEDKSREEKRREEKIR